MNALVTWWLPAQEQNIVCISGSTCVRSELDVDKLSYKLRSNDGAWQVAGLGKLFDSDGVLKSAVLDNLVRNVVKTN